LGLTSRVIVKFGLGCSEIAPCCGVIWEGPITNCYGRPFLKFWLMFNGGALARLFRLFDAVVFLGDAAVVSASG